MSYWLFTSVTVTPTPEELNVTVEPLDTGQYIVQKLLLYADTWKQAAKAVKISERN